jgi:translation elongation factor EF-Ts
MSDKTKIGKPISIKDLSKLNLNEKITKLTANILYTKTDLIKENIKKELNITQDQFETILRKNPEKISTELIEGTENSIICERVYFEKKYLFTSQVAYFNSTVDLFSNKDKITTNIVYEIYKEISIKDLENLLDVDEEQVP